MIQVGDLVKCRNTGHRIGLVIDEKLANDGLMQSKHAVHLQSNLPVVYYVYFSDIGRTGPYYSAEMVSV